MSFTYRPWTHRGVAKLTLHHPTQQDLEIEGATAEWAHTRLMLVPKPERPKQVEALYESLAAPP